MVPATSGTEIPHAALFSAWAHKVYHSWHTSPLNGWWRSFTKDGVTTDLVEVSELILRPRQEHRSGPEDGTCLFVLRHRGDDRIYEMRCLFVAVRPNARFIVLPHWDNMS